MCMSAWACWSPPCWQPRATSRHISAITTTAASRQQAHQAGAPRAPGQQRCAAWPAAPTAAFTGCCAAGAASPCACWSAPICIALHGSFPNSWQGCDPMRLYLGNPLSCLLAQAVGPCAPTPAHHLRILVSQPCSANTFVRCLGYACETVSYNPLLSSGLPPNLSRRPSPLPANYVARQTCPSPSNK